jgi:DNA polymerase
MPDRPALPLAEQIAAAQAWWHEAGVDHGYADDPQAWLAEPSVDEPVAPVIPDRAMQEEPERLRIGGDAESWPRDLAGFRAWWLEAPALHRTGPYPRLAPRGPGTAPLAVLVPMPEAEDTERLLSGPQGRLIASMARAMGFEPEVIYLASALPCHETMPDWAGLGRDGIGEVLRHHLALAAPARLIVLGRDISPLLRHDWTQPTPAIDKIEIQGRMLPVMTSYSPARLLEHPRLRKGLWQQWLDWSEGDLC